MKAENKTRVDFLLNLFELMILGRTLSPAEEEAVCRLAEHDTLVDALTATVPMELKPGMVAHAYVEFDAGGFLPEEGGRVTKAMHRLGLLPRPK